MVDPNQFGFVKGRTLDDGIQSMQKIIHSINQSLQGKEAHTSTDTSFTYEASLNVDFEKAFDRVSFRYLESVMQHLNFPPSFINQALSLTRFQHGQLILNGSVSELSFDFSNGVRQGSPLSPSLFLLVVESMTFNCDNGIPIEGTFVKKDISSISYADDINLFIEDRYQLLQVIRNIETFERLSNMKINLEKSNLLYLKEEPAYLRPGQKSYEEEYGNGIGVHIPGTHIKDANNIKFLGMSVNGTSHWPEIIKKIERQVIFPMLTHLPMITRTKSHNIYIMSQIYGKDHHDPLKPQQLKKLDSVIQDTHFKGVHIDTLKLPESHGGFNLMDLSTQLHGKRAKRFFDIIKNKQFAATQTKESLQWLAVCICYFFHTSFQTRNRTKDLHSWGKDISDTTVKFKAFSWLDFLNGSFEKFFNEHIKGTSEFKESYAKVNSSRIQERDNIIINNHINIHAILFQILPKFRVPNYLSDSTKNSIKFTMNINHLLTPTELEGLQSWFVLFNNFTTQDTSTIPKLGLHNWSKQKIFGKEILNNDGSRMSHMKDLMGNPLTSQSFKQTNKIMKLKDTKVKTRTTSYDTEYSRLDVETEKATASRYKRFWERMKEVNRTKPGFLETLHRFNLGHIEHHHFPQSTDNRQCYNCGSYTTKLEHYMEKCKVTIELWKRLGYNKYQPKPFTLTQLTTPTEHTSYLPQLRAMSLWIDTVIASKITSRNNEEITMTDLVNVCRYKKKICERQYGYGREGDGS